MENIDLPVEFGGFSFGGNDTCRIGIKIDRAVCNPIMADETFCGRRLTGQLVLGHHDDTPGQTLMFDDAKIVEGVFDAKQIGLTPELVKFGATFNEASIPAELLMSFAKQKGRLLVSKVEDIPDEKQSADDEGAATKFLPGALAIEGEWAAAKLSSLLKPATAKKLAKAKITTMGDLAAYTSRPDADLIDIPGIGPGAKAEIEAMNEAFWADNPQ